MKKIGLGLISASLLLLSLVIFQNCGGFAAGTDSSNQLSEPEACSLDASCILPPSGLPCAGIFNAQILGQTTTITMTETSSGAVSMLASGMTFESGTCSDGNITFTAELAGLTAQCTGTYSVSGSITAMSGTCADAGTSVPWTATEQ